MDLDEAVSELYGCELADFVSTRTRVARLVADTDEAAQVRRLRKPTVSAWLLNQLVREDPGVIADVERLGSAMRRLQAKGDARALRELRQEREELLTRVVAGVEGVARERGRPLPASGVDEVSATVIAALADAGSAAALASGMLVRSLSYSGFGEVDLDDAVATRAHLRLVPADGGGESADPCSSEAGSSEAARDERAQDELAAAVVRLQTAEADIVPAQEALDEAQAELARAQEALRVARERADGARAELGRRRRSRDAQQQNVSALRRAALARESDDPS